MAATNATRKTQPKSTATTPSVVETDVSRVAAAIGMPASDWPGNCFAIATAMVEAGLAPGGRAVYGHYLGRVKEGTLFTGRPLVPHCWILLADGRIADPTRWVFEGVEPYVFVGLADHPDYDEGGNAWRRMNERPAPAFDPSQQTLELPDGAAVTGIVQSLLGRDGRTVCFGELYWLANLSLITLGAAAEPVYRFLVDNGLAALIPLDNRLKVLGEP